MNGRPILIRGAGWTFELMLRYSRERLEQEVAYVKDMGLNTIRLEGKLEDEPFFDITDREGILVMPGWCCCDNWEHWKTGTRRTCAWPRRRCAIRSCACAAAPRSSPGSTARDNPPPAHVEKAYLDVLDELGFPNPVVSSATEKKAEYSGASGVKMMGPYEWVPPLYWYTDTKVGGPHGFATEIGPGPAPPPLESLKRFLPEAELWPIGEAWNFHCGGGPFRTLDVFTKAMDARYGPSKDVAEYARKAQAAAYESHRAMLESFGERKYVATGVIQWMLNNAWPGADLAPLRLLPAAGRLVLRRQEGAASRCTCSTRTTTARSWSSTRACRRTPACKATRARARPRVEDALRAERARSTWAPTAASRCSRSRSLAGLTPTWFLVADASTTRAGAP